MSHPWRAQCQHQPRCAETETPIHRARHHLRAAVGRKRDKVLHCMPRVIKKISAIPKFSKRPCPINTPSWLHWLWLCHSVSILPYFASPRSRPWEGERSGSLDVTECGQASLNTHRKEFPDWTGPNWVEPGVGKNGSWKNATTKNSKKRMTFIFETKKF